MPVIRYCDNPKCHKQIAAWDNEYGQVMSVIITVTSSDRSDNGVPDGTKHYCSAACAQTLLDICKEREQHWLDVWTRGKILGKAPVMPKKINRRE